MIVHIIRDADGYPLAVEYASAAKVAAKLRVAIRAHDDFAEAMQTVARSVAESPAVATDAGQGSGSDSSVVGDNGPEN